MKKTILIIFGSIIFLYLIMPFVSGLFEFGDRMGPKIYPVKLHEALYRLGWSLGKHDGSKPRIEFWVRPENRPWFYGMYSKNYDPNVIKVQRYGPDVIKMQEKD